MSHLEPPPAAPSPTSAHAFLSSAATSGRLGEGPREQTLHPSPLRAFLVTLPWSLLVLQLVWSSLILLAAYRIGVDKYGRLDTLGDIDENFWATRLNVPSSVVYGVGWALFVLLGFYIRDSTHRNHTATSAILRAAHHTRYLANNILYSCPPGSWHPGDVDRLIRHLVAYPIALKMQLRGDRSREQLDCVLHPKDTDDVLAAKAMHVQCSRLIRAYTLTCDDDTPFWPTEYVSTPKKPMGYASLYVLLDGADRMDNEAQKAVALSEFRSSRGYVNHLRIFMYIWMMFLPLALIKSSGWFTPLWAVLITHGIGMLFNIASALNDPFGFDIHDIKLNRLSATAALSILDIYMKGTVNNEYLVDETHDTPRWLEDEYAKHTQPSTQHSNVSNPKKTTESNDDEKVSVPKPNEDDGSAPAKGEEKTKAKPKRSSILKWKPELYLPMAVYVAWCLFIVFLTWGLTRDEPRADKVRWWDIYIPLDSSTASYVSLGIFLLLGFWMSDAYGRYRSAIDLWQAGIPSNINDILLYISTTLRAGLWHTRDHERLLSFFAALPYVSKQQLCGSTDYSDLDGLLSAKDIARIQSEKNPTQYMFDVIRAYVYAADSLTNVKIDPHEPASVNGIYLVALELRTLEDQFFECTALQQVPIPYAFTSHLYLFTVFWLALLPLTLVLHDGFVSFVYLLPVGYSIVNLLIVGKEMADPFGTDEHDLPLDNFCADLKANVRDIYIASREGPKSFVKNTGGYDRASFVPLSQQTQASTTAVALPKGPSPLSSVRTILQKFPSVSPFPIAATFAWAVISVFLSKALGDRWGDQRGNECAKWCSPIDVQGTVLANVGFALFMILAFRAADAIKRYDVGAELLQTMRLRLRDYVLDMVMFFDDAEFHPNDKERMIAHAVQVPLCLRDMMLGREGERKHENTLLNEIDFERYINAPSPMEYLFQTMISYIAIQDVSYRDLIMDNGRYGPTAISFNVHVQAIRTMVARANAIKRFPVIRSYTNHQHLFTAIWLLLLPLAMTRKTGYFTILWAPLISYGVLCLEAIAVKLVDPYGTDDIDLPVDDICKHGAAEVTDLVRRLDWNCHTLVRESHVDSSPVLETDITERAVLVKRKVLNTTDNFNPLKGSDPNAFDSSAPTPKAKPTLYAHLIRSVPWWTIVIITAWTAVGCLISYLSRDRTESVRWWVSNFSVSTDVGTYLSFLAFTVLGFYVNEAFARYSTAGSIWDCTLRKSCHLVTNYIMAIIPPNAIHDGDQARIVAHLAALPLVLKAELRDSRDLREVSGLLSHADLGLLQTAPSMSRHCLDVLLAYWCRFVKRDMEVKAKMNYLGINVQMLRYELSVVEEAVAKALLVKNFPIAPAFIHLLNSLLGIFFLVLPFILAEVSGWLSILWVPIVAYGVFGMYKVAGELQDPYGTDLNDLNLDCMADEIAREVLFVYKQQQTGHTSLISEGKKMPEYWTVKSTDIEQDPNVFNKYDILHWTKRTLYDMKMALTAVPAWLLIVSTAWAAIAVMISYMVSRHLPQTDGNSRCQWFCSAISISSSVISYVGFVLFLLLGFFLYDSHWRYVHGLDLWRNQLLNILRITASRTFQAYYSGFWHEHDRERIAGHLAASVIALKGDLRGNIDRERLLKVLPADDVAKVLQSPDKVNYCFDVLRSYLIHSERVDPTAKARNPVPGDELCIIDLRARVIGDAAFQCRTIIALPLPFGYVQHLRIFLAIWLLLFPFGIVESTGWISVLWMAIISYGMIGIDRWAEKLSDPFGDDITDLPLDEMVDDIVHTIKETLHLFENGVDRMIVRDRNAQRDGDETTKPNGTSGAVENI